MGGEKTIQEVNINEIKSIYDPSASFYICCEVPNNFVYFDNYSNCPVLKPDLTKERKIGLITKEEFERKYKIKIKNSAGVSLIGHMKKQPTSIYLVTDVDTGTLMSIVNSV